MTRIPKIFYSLLLIGLTALLAGQATSEITLHDIYHTQKFKYEGLYGLSSMNDGIHYTVKKGTKN